MRDQAIPRRAGIRPVRRRSGVSPVKALLEVSVLAVALMIATAIRGGSVSGSELSSPPPTSAYVGAAGAVSDTTAAAHAPATDTAIPTTPATVAAVPDPITSEQAAPNVAEPLDTSPLAAAQPPSSAAYTRSSFSVESAVPFTQPMDCGGGATCQVRVDIYVPSGPGTYPTVVLVGPSGRGYLASLAGDLASRGILVFDADFRDVGASGGGYPAGFQDVACAVRFARSEASRYRGDSVTVTLVGHSLGGWVGSVVALDPTEFQGGCLAGGSGRPDAFVGLAGNYQISSGENAGDLESFFGGSASATAQSRSASDPFNYAGGSPIPVRLVAGTDDETVDPGQSKALNAYLVKQGWDVSLTMVDGGGHMTILAAQSTYDAVFSAVAAASAAKAPPAGVAR